MFFLIIAAALSVTLYKCESIQNIFYHLENSWYHYLFVSIKYKF